MFFRKFLRVAGPVYVAVRGLSVATCADFCHPLSPSFSGSRSLAPANIVAGVDNILNLAKQWYTDRTKKNREAMMSQIIQFESATKRRGSIPLSSENANISNLYHTIMEIGMRQYDEATLDEVDQQAFDALLLFGSLLYPFTLK